MKHTPGKWSIDTNRMVSIDDAAQSDNWIAVGLSDDDGFAEIVAMTTPENAPLIAAAPELVDVLQEMTKRYANLERLYFKALNLLDRSETNGTINRAQNLLARIEGKP